MTGNVSGQQQEPKFPTDINAPTTKKTAAAKTITGRFAKAFTKLTTPSSKISVPTPEQTKSTKPPIKAQTDEVIPPFTEELFSDRELKNGASDNEFLQMKFEYKNKVMAKETASRVSTVNLLLDGLKTKQEYLMKSINNLENTPIDSKNKKEIFNKLAKQSEQLGEVNKRIESYNILKGKTWGSTNAPRLFFQQGGEKALEEYAPLLLNLRHQHVEDESGNVLSRVNRSAAVSDFSHGEISLQELKDYRELQQLSHGQSSPRGDFLRDLYELNDPKGNIDQKKLRQLLETIRDAAAKSYGAGILSSDKSDIKADKLNGIINQRSAHLTQLVLQDLHTHFIYKPAENAETLVGRVGLLAPTKKTDTNKDGFCMNERSQCLDMQAIYDEFDGKTVVFDIEDDFHAAPFMDEKGIIHMPKSCGNQEQTTLKTAFFNVSVQGGTRNKGIQKVINDRTLQKLNRLNEEKGLQGELGEDTKTLQNLLELHSKATASDPFDLALAATTLINKSGGYLSANCYGGKDRTGYLVALITKRALQERLNKEKMDPKERKHLLRQWSLDLVGENSIAAYIVEDNANHRVLKLKRYRLELYSPQTKEGLVERIDAYGRAAFLFASGKQVSFSENPNQAYFIEEGKNEANQ